VPDFKAKMHQIQFVPPKPLEECSLDPIGELKGRTSKEREGTGRKGEEE